MRLIDADALAETLGITDMSCERCAWYDRTKSLCGRGGDFEDACAAIEDAPTVEERKTGKWNCGDDMFEYAVCSCCEWDSGEAWEYAKKYFSFCPNCGASMEE